MSCKLHVIKHNLYSASQEPGELSFSWQRLIKIRNLCTPSKHFLVLNNEKTLALIMNLCLLTPNLNYQISQSSISKISWFYSYSFKPDLAAIIGCFIFTAYTQRYSSYSEVSLQTLTRTSKWL